MISLDDLTFSIAPQKRFVLGESENECVIYDELSFSRYNNDYCGPSSSPDHRVRKLIKFLKGVFSFVWRRHGYCELFCCLRLMTPPTTNLISLPFSHLKCDFHDVKRFLFRATSPKSWASNFYYGVKGAILGSKMQKNEDTNSFVLLTLFLKLVKQFYKLIGL